MKLRSEEPKVSLAKFFTSPFDNAVATARTCYSSRVITDEDVRKNIPLRDRIAASTYKAGHHTTLQHAHFEFIVDGVSRQALWSFFHAHPFYNSEQVSQRYVEVKPGRVLKPALDDKLDALWDACVERQMRVYHELNELLLPTVQRLYFGIFPARDREVVDKRWTGAMKKRAQEVSRYVLPIGTHAHLYHTVSGLTLHRYHRIADSHDCPSEQRIIVDKMIDCLRAVDPDFGALLEDTLPLEDTPDARALRRVRGGAPRGAGNGAVPADGGGAALVDAALTRAFKREFDDALEGRTSKLVSMTTEPARLLARCVREALGVPRARLSDEDAVAMLLDPRENAALGESLSLLTLQKASRALEMVHFTFQRKISHSADSQAQRHRMTPGTRPVLWTQFVPGEPDYVLPVIFEQDDAAKARALYEGEMRAVFEDIRVLHEAGVEPEVWQYLLPNAAPVRYTETGSLLDQHHKWTTRLCYNAQEEIWRASKDEVEQLAMAAPELATWLLPPCGQRKRAEVTPYCPEGERFCGQPVWTQERSSYLRVL